MYTIGQISKMFHLPISTIRYYDKQGLFPYIERVSGIRKFSEKEVEALRVIECLKKSGLEIKVIKDFMDWCTQGSSTYDKRGALFIAQRENVKSEIERLNNTLAIIEFKCWYYSQLQQGKTEEMVNDLIPNKLPPEIKTLYEYTHSPE